MVQPRDRFGLRQETQACFRRRVIPGQDHLERDDAIEPQLPSLVDDPHAATAQLPENLVAGNGRNARWGRLRQHAPDNGQMVLSLRRGPALDRVLNLELEPELGEPAPGNGAGSSSSGGDSPVSSRSTISL